MNELDEKVKDILDSLSTEVGNHFGFNNIFIKTRDRDYADARRIFNYIAYTSFRMDENNTGRHFVSINKLTLSQLGYYGGKRHHATVLNSIKDMEFNLKHDVKIRNAYNSILSSLNIDFDIDYEILISFRDKLLSRVDDINGRIKEIEDRREVSK